MLYLQQKGAWLFSRRHFSLPICRPYRTCLRGVGVLCYHSFVLTGLVVWWRAFLVTILSSLQDLVVGCGWVLLPFFRPYTTGFSVEGIFRYHSVVPTGLERCVWVFFATILSSLQDWLFGGGHF